MRYSFPIKSALNAAYRSNLIQDNSNKETKSEPEYSLVSVDFNTNSRMAKIVFSSAERYRTIERYVTQDYQKYPVYSDWKVKTKNISKSLKLTNDVLEGLAEHSDPLIRKFSVEIILFLKTEALIPSWLNKRRLIEGYNRNLSYLLGNKRQLDIEHSQVVGSLNNKILQARNEIAVFEVQKNKYDRLVNKCSMKIGKIQQHKKSVILVILTLFIYHFLNSPGRIARISKRKSEHEQTSLDIQENIQDLNRGISSFGEKIDIATRRYEEQKQIIAHKCERLKSAVESDLRKVTPLIVECPVDSDFLPMNAIKGIKHEKIVGCYVIRNRMNGRCYVGQSKDVMKRINQHFKGTIPGNVIFAEDYYSSPPDKKNDLFEVKIIRLHTKDELDTTERELIQFYDSYSHGYNGTAGNS